MAGDKIISPKKETGIFSSLIQHSKKIMIVLGTGSVVMSVIIVALVWFLNSESSVVASYEGKEILRSDFEDAKTKCDGFYKYNSDPNGQKKCSETEIEDQIFRKALETEAEKRNITVTEKEIEERYKGLVSSYKSEESYKRTIKSAYGWTPEYVKANMKRDILQDKLQPYLIASRDGYGVFVRWDWYIGEPSKEQRKANEVPSRELLEKNLFPLMKSGASKEALRAEITRLRTLGNPWDKEYNIGLIPFNGLNSQNGENIGKEDWQAISKLQNPGDTTDVIRSTMGQFAVYRLENKTDGNFTSWDEFKKDAVGRAKVKSVSYRYKQLRKLTVSKVKSYGNSVCEKLHITNEAFALSCSVGQYNFSEFYGYIYDGSNHALALSNVNVKATNNAPTRTDLMCAEEPLSTEVNTGADGGFTIGSRGTWDARFGTYSHSPWVLSCYHGWIVDLSKRGYDSIQFNRSTAPNGGRYALDRVYESWETYAGPEGSYRSWNNDNNTYLFMKPTETLGWHDQANCSVISGWSLDMSDPDYQSGIHLYQTSKNLEWCGTDPTCTGGYLPSASANQPRPDIASYYGISNGNHEFSIVTPSSDVAGHSIMDNTDHWIWAYAFTKSGSPFKLGNTPIKINCPPIVTLTPTCMLNANSTSVKQGDPVTLSWSVENKTPPFYLGVSTGSDILLSSASQSGTFKMLPLSDTIYTLKDSDHNPISNGGDTCQETVSIIPNMSGNIIEISP